MALIIDQALGHKNLNELTVLVAIMFVTPVVSGLIGVGQTYRTTAIGQSVMRDFRVRLYSHLQAMSLRFFTATKTGEIISRLNNDVNGVQAVVTGTMSSIVNNVVVVVSTLVVMFGVNW